ncbi:MAG: CsbD family protein [Rhodanobacter sp.]
MNNDRIKGNWKQLSGKIKAKWGDLTDDDLTRTEGDYEYLVGKVQERYGIAKDEAAKQVESFQDTL